MAERGLEFGVTEGFGWIKGDVAAIAPSDPALKIPHMGWNELRLARPDHPLLAGIGDGAHAYFVHSYAFVCAEDANVLARVDYGEPITAIIGRDNIVGTQFHPEKSQSVGLRLIANFLGWRP
jgi:glutamine amidotransferase